MELLRIAIENVRAIASLEIDLSIEPDRARQRQILLGANGSGKTTVLNVIADVITGLRSETAGRRLGPRDVRMHPKPIESPPLGMVTVELLLNDEEIERARLVDRFIERRVTLRNTVGSPRTSDLDPASQLAQLEAFAGPELRVQAALQRALSGAEFAPCVLLPASRGVLNAGEDVTVRELRDFDVRAASLSSDPQRFATLAARLAMAFLAPDQFDPGRRVARMWKVLERYLPELPRPVSVDGLTLLLENRHGVVVRVSDLSDGERAVLLIFAELALRFPQGGIVLIDEIEQHLHPRWQRNIIEALPAFIPTAQWIVTTQAPYIAANAPDDVRKIGDWDQHGE